MFRFRKEGNALIIVLVLTVIIVPIGLIMMQRMRTVNHETRKIYNSFVLEHTARSGIELIINKLRFKNFSTGPHEASISESTRYIAYVDTTGIGLVGQKICHVFSRAESDEGNSLLMIATVEVYPRGDKSLVIPHSFYIIEKDLFIETFSARQAILNFKSLQNDAFVQQLRQEARVEIKDYQQNLRDLQSTVPLELQTYWNTKIIPEIITRKISIRN